MLEFFDTYKKKVQVTISSAACESCIWIFLEDEEHAKMDKVTNSLIYPGIHLNKHKAQILASQLQEWIEIID